MKTAFFFLFVALETCLMADGDLDKLKLNQIQLIGSHNSYKQAIDPLLFAFLSKRDSASMSKIEYSHISLSEQLDMGLRNLEIDVYADPAGGKYSRPLGLQMVQGQPVYDSGKLMLQPGFKVFHIPDIDFRSNCPTFKLCLQELKRWSELHPDHYPVFVTMNAKEDGLPMPGFVVPQKFTAATYDSLDQEIVSNLGIGHLIVPATIRGKYPTLEAAVLHQNWPLLKNAKGKFIFILDETGNKTAEYIRGHASLKDRILFTNSAAGTPEAAIMILNNAKKDSITAMVKKGYIVRTRADADTREARNNDRSSFDAACSSGAQIITTDYYQKSTHFKSEYVIKFADDMYIRPNPVFQLSR